MQLLSLFLCILSSVMFDDKESMIFVNMGTCVGYSDIRLDLIGTYLCVQKYKLDPMRMLPTKKKKRKKKIFNSILITIINIAYCFSNFLLALSSRI